MLTVNFVGCGRLGKTLGQLIVKYNLAQITGILCSSWENSNVAAQFIGQGQAYRHMAELPQANIYFIVTPDDLIEAMCDKLIETACPPAGSLVIHCSGTLTSDVLHKAKEKGCVIASIHPLKSFADPAISAQSFAGTYCAFEGEEASFEMLSAFVKNLGGQLFTIDKTQKNIYHAASVMANNFLISLHYIANETYKIAGVDAKIANNITSQFMQNALDNKQMFDYHQALTGPYARGDIETIKKHLVSLQDHPAIYDLYLALAKSTLPITKHAETLKNKLGKLIASHLRID